jgi:hypothetical protein
MRSAVLFVAGLALALPISPAAIAAPAPDEALTPEDGAGEVAAQVVDQAGRKKKKDKKGGDKKAGGGKGGSPEKGKEKPFEEIVKEFEVHEGLFTLYTKEDKVLMEIKPDQYDKIYLITLSRTGGVGQLGALLGNQQMFNAPVVFHKVGEKVQVLYKNVFYRAGDNNEMKKAVEASFSDSLMGTSKIASAPHPERESELIDVSEVLISDVDGVGAMTGQALQSPFKLDRGNSYFQKAKAFPENIEITAVLHFKNSAPKQVLQTLPDPRSMFLRYNYSISALPAGEGFVPRIADDRIGHFASSFGDYSDDELATPYSRYVDRWHLEKADPLLEVSEVKNPITYHLDHSVPKKFRGALTEGALLWNEAFERVGYKNAVVVKEAPADADWDTADVRYSSIRWFVSPYSTFAIGPSFANPLTGQIYDADIGVAEGWIRIIRNRYREEADPVALFTEAADEAWQTAVEGWDPSQYALKSGPGVSATLVSQCGVGMYAAERAAFGHSVLAARGMKPGSPEEDAFLRNFLIWMTAHEVGHTLGLRHNFRASTVHPNGDIHDVEKTSKIGLSGSVMDYTAPNIAAEGKTQGQYFQTNLGPYDYWAIEYAYKPTDAERPEDEIEELKKIASRAAEPLLAYSTDEDAMHFVATPVGMDPRTYIWDLGADPIDYFADRIKIARELWSKLPEGITVEGDGYQAVRRAFNQGISEYFPAMISITKYVGGVQHNRHHVGDPSGSLPYVPVPAEDQRRALKWLDTYLFGADAFTFSPELVRMLAANRFGNTSYFALLPRLDYPLHNTVLSLQNLALARLYHPALLDRVVDMDTKVAGDHVDLAEVFGTLRDGIWGEVSGSGTNINGSWATPRPRRQRWPGTICCSSARRSARL